MQVIRSTSDVAQVRNLVIRDFLAKRIDRMASDWAPDSWENYGQFLVLEAGDEPSIVESANCSRLVSSPFGQGRLGDKDFLPVWWDWMNDHGSFYEVAMIVSDAGNFDVVLIPKAAGISPALLKLCEEVSALQAVPASPDQPVSPLVS
jgi:hypothetical protein